MKAPSPVTAIMIMAKFTFAITSALIFVWVIVFVVYKLMPGELIRQLDRTTYYAIERYFFDVDIALGLKEDIGAAGARMQKDNFFYLIPYQCMNITFSNIPEYEDVPSIPDPSILLSADMASRVRLQGEDANILAAVNLVGIVNQLEINLRETRIELKNIERDYKIFSAVIVILGMLNTIASAINSFSNADTRIKHRHSIRIIAVALPALVTAITALSSIYTPPDTISKKNQLLSSLINVRSEVQSYLTAMACPVDDTAVAALSQATADWQRKVSTAIAIAEASRGDGKEAAQGVLPLQSVQPNIGR